MYCDYEPKSNEGRKCIDHIGSGLQPSGDSVCKPNTCVDNSTSQCKLQGQTETLQLYSLKSEQFVSGSNSISSDVKACPPRLNCPVSLASPSSSGFGSMATAGSSVTSNSLQNAAGCNDRQHRISAPPTDNTSDCELQTGSGDEVDLKRASHGLQHPVQETEPPHSSDIVVAIPIVPRRIGLVFSSDQ